MKKIIFFMLIMGGGVISSFAQVNTKRYNPTESFSIYPKFKISKEKTKKIKMPKFDIASLLEEDEATKGLNLPFRFGKGFDVDYSLKDGTWVETIGVEFGRSRFNRMEPILLTLYLVNYFYPAIQRFHRVSIKRTRKAMKSRTSRVNYLNRALLLIFA